MKTTLLYGLLIGALNFVVTLGFSAAGYYADAQKVAIVQGVSPWTSLLIGVVFTYLGIRACRSALAPQLPYTYGQAVGAGALITLWAVLTSLVTTLLFFNVINPDARETLIQAQLNKVATQGADPEKVEKFIRMTMGNIGLCIFVVLLGAFFGMIFTLIVSIFLRRSASRLAEPPMAEPPAAPTT